MFRLSLALAVFSALALIGCASAPGTRTEPGAIPSLRLAPSELGREMAVQQRLSFRHGDSADTVDALVEVDARQVRVLVHAQGQVALRLAWDGEELVQSRAEWLPATLTGERVLDGLQLVFWPVPAIAAALPRGWTVTSSEGERVVWQRGQRVASVAYPEPGRALLTQHRQGYSLDILSRPVQP